MVVVRTNPLSTLDDTSWNGSRILNGSGKIVLILDPTSKSDLDNEPWGSRRVTFVFGKGCVQNLLFI